MKKVTFLLAALLVGGMMLTGCKKDDPNNNNNNGGGETPGAATADRHLDGTLYLNFQSVASHCRAAFRA